MEARWRGRGGREQVEVLRRLWRWRIAPNEEDREWLEGELAVADHPFGRMVRERLSVALCTDNRLVSPTTVTRELAEACEAFDLAPNELRNVTIHGFKRSFFPGTYREKRTYVRQTIDYYDRLAAEAGLPPPHDRVTG